MMLTVKTKLTLAFGIITSLFVISISVVGFVNFKASSVANYSNLLNQQAFLIASSVEQRMTRYFEVLDTTAASLPITEGTILDMEGMMQQLENAHDLMQVLDVYVGFRNGDTYASIRDGIVPNFNAKELDREWYRRIFAGEDRIITTPYVSAAGNLVMAVGVPVFRDGQVIATLCMNLPVDRITGYVNQLAEGNKVYASRSDGFVLASSVPAEIGKNLFQLNPSFSSFSKQDRSEHAYRKNNEDRFVASARIPSLGWNFWVWDSEANINKSSNRNLLFSLILSLVLVAAALAISYFLVVRLMYLPIGGEPRLIEALIRRIAHGDLACAPKAKASDTGVHAEVLQMADNLRNIVSDINASATQLSGVYVFP